jgi:predicted enzyme related to lactoylglutathione lyase
MDVMAHSAGTFCFAELTTPDMEAAKRFYGSIFGWTAFDVPGAVGNYALFRQNGKDVAGLNRSSQGRHAWLHYVAVDSADDSASRARELGAVIVAEPFDVPGIGRMAMFTDPAGASAALWEPRGYAGAQLVDETGAMTWHELVVRDIDAARRFYTALFGWTTTRSTVVPGDYTLFTLGDRQVGGLLQIGDDWGPVPPHWQVYFAATDCAGVATRVEALGGCVYYGPQDIADIGRLVILADPGRATFAVWQDRRIGGSADQQIGT